MQRYKNTAKVVKNPSDIFIYFVLGELPAVIHFSQLFFDKIKQHNRYCVVVTWDGMERFFNTADEVLGVGKNLSFKTIYKGANYLSNTSGSAELLLRSANEHFLNVQKADSLGIQYDKTFSDHFLGTRFTLESPYFVKETDRVYDFKINKKSVVFFPIDFYKTIVQGNDVPVIFNSGIYKEIFRVLSSLGFKIICVQNDWCYNLSANPISADVQFFHENSFDKIIMLIRKHGCFFDLFTDLSILSYLAQVPCFSVFERSSYAILKRDIEKYVFDFTNSNKILFSFFSSFFKNNGLNHEHFNSIIDRFAEFYEDSVANQRKQLIQSKEVNFDPYLRHIANRTQAKFISKLLLNKKEERNA